MQTGTLDLPEPTLPAPQGGDPSPGSPPRRWRVHRRARKALAGALFVALGALAGFGALPSLFRVLPHDLHRSGTILSALGEGSPDAVIFGSSVGMSAIDARLLSAELQRLRGGRAELVYNLSAEAQEPAEAALLYQELPPSVQTVVQLIRPGSLDEREHLWPGKFTGLFMFGYRPDEGTIAAMERVYGRSMRQLLTRSAFWHHAQARWVPHSALDVAVHRRLRSEIPFARAEYDLFFPSFYTEPISPAALEAALAGTPAEPGKRLALSAEASALLEELCTLATRTNPRRKVVFVLETLHPRLHELYGEAYFRDLDRLAATRPCGGRASFINAVDAAPAAAYADNLHLLPAGAQTFTRWLAGRLAERR